MSELDLYPPMLEYLVLARRIRNDTLVDRELPVHGRSVDFVTLTRTGCLTAYEFKLRDVGRALRQAAYNLRSFDRSYVVVSRVPTDERLEIAATLGIGVFVVANAEVEPVIGPGPPNFVRAARERVELRMRTRGVPWSEHVWV